MEHLLSTVHFFNSSWQSVDRIPIVLSLLKEELNQLETANSADSPSHGTALQKKLSCFQALYQHWGQMDLNPRQTEWVAEMRLLSADMATNDQFITPITLFCSLTPGRPEKIRISIELRYFNKQ